MIIVHYAPHALPLARATVGSSGYDLRAAEDYTIDAEHVVLFKTGVHLEMPPGMEAQVRARSGLAFKGIYPPHGIGTIDSDYRGEIGVLLKNGGNWPYEIRRGDRIAQLVFAEVLHPAMDVGELGDTGRGAGGFGSTGR